MHAVSPVDLIVPIKPLSNAKSRLVGAADRGIGDSRAHQLLVLALVIDTITAALRSPLVDRVCVVTPDPQLAQVVDDLGAMTVLDEPRLGLNSALVHAARSFHAPAGRGNAVGALMADLPALRTSELTAAIAAAGGKRAFCPDAEGTGTTLLLSETDRPLQPRFGSDSARRHRLSRAQPLLGPWPSLRRDVDTGADLLAAGLLGLHAATLGLVSKPPNGAETQVRE